MSALTIPLPSVERRWSIGIARPDSPLAFAAPTRPVFAREQTGADAAYFVADPFLARTEHGWFVFFELFGAGGRGRIGHAWSADGTAWTYCGIALEEPFHLSYPCVVRADDGWYMAPESVATGEVRIYQATSFPGRWVMAAIAVRGKRLVDPTVFRHEGQWWLLAAAADNRSLFAYHAEHPVGPWIPHAANPVVEGAARARPGGRPFVVDGRLWRPAQDVSGGYGRHVRAIEIFELTPRTYREGREGAPLGAPSGRGWNAHGMHHVDAQIDGRGGWIVAMDGFRLDLMFGYRRLGARA